MSLHSGMGRILLMAVGLLAFIGFSGAGVWMSWSRYSHSKNWTPAQARVVALDERCQVQVKRRSGSSDTESWFDEGGEKPCSEVEGVSAMSLLGQKRRVQRYEYASLTYEAGGQSLERRIRRDEISARKVVEGETIPIFVDPQNAARIDRSLSTMDMIFSGLFVLAGLLFLVSTFAFPHLWRASSRRGTAIDIRST